MKCFYINLDSAVERRAAIESNFSAVRKDGWDLTRLAAFDADYVNRHKIAGRLKPAEKACFLSHKKIIAENRESHEPLFIVEDDVLFGRRTFSLVEKFLERREELKWDLLYTDVCIPQVGAMADLISLRHQLVAKNEVRCIDLKPLPFAGGTAYIVNPKSKNKIHDLLDPYIELDIAYDLYLRKLIRESRLNGFVLFPFVTSLSQHAQSSLIQSDKTSRTDLVWNLYRQLVWLEADPAQCKALIDYIDRALSVEARMFGTLWAAMTEKSFQLK